MKFCQPHWDALRAAIDKRGLTDLVAKGGLAAAENMKAELDGTATLANYDPLMAAHWAIVNNVNTQGGPEAVLYLLSAEDACPLCYANEQHKLHCHEEGCEFTFDNWVERAADDQLQHVNELRAGGGQETH